MTRIVHTFAFTAGIAFGLTAVVATIILTYPHIGGPR